MALEPMGGVGGEILARMQARQAEYDLLPKCPACGEVLEVPCRTCEERAARARTEEAQQRERDIRRLGGLKAYESFWFKNYDNKPAIDACAGYPDSNLYIYGPAGTGKTHLAAALVRGFADGVVVKPAHIYRKCRGIKDGAEEQAAINKIAGLRHLVVDDLGVGGKTDFSVSVLYEVIEARDMNRATGLIVTSNLSLGELAERLGDDRVSSRLGGMCKVVRLTGVDRRGKTKEKI